AASAAASTGIQAFCPAPILMVPALAGRTAPAGSGAFAATAVSATCVPFGLKLGAGPLPGARYASGTWTTCSCDSNDFSETTACHARATRSVGSHAVEVFAGAGVAALL